MSEGKPIHGEIHRADPTYRRQLQISLAVCVGASLVGLVALHFWLQDLSSSIGHENPGLLELWLRRLISALGLMMSISAAAFAVWLRRIGLQASAGKRWPPADLRTAKDVPVRYLGAAEAMAQQLQLAAAVLFVFAALVAAWAIWVGWSG